MQPRRAFTLVEVLVALMLMGVAAAGLVAALAGDHQLRESSAAYDFVAGRVRERLEILAALPCAADAAGMTTSVWGVDRWHAQRAQQTWHLTDSLVPLARPAAPIIVEARVACPG